MMEIIGWIYVCPVTHKPVSDKIVVMQEKPTYTRLSNVKNLHKKEVTALKVKITETDQ